MPTTASIEAKHGQKMVEVRIRFWTNEISPEAGKVVPKHAWTRGVVRMAPNESHGIKSGRPKPFHSLLDVGSVIEKVLIQHHIVLHPSQRMRKYISE